MNVRECFTPRKGYVYAQADYEQLELHTLAQVCFRLYGYSVLGDVLNEGLDPHTELASEILGIAPEQGRKRRKDKNDKEFDGARQLAKIANFGLPGGMGAKRFLAALVQAGIEGATMALAQKIKAAWLRRWPELALYFDRIATLTSTPEGTCTLVDPFTGRVRGGVQYTNGCNDGFQSLGAAVAKEATWLVSKACYIGQKEPVMLGSRIVNMIHDELILEVPDDPRAHDVAKALERLMVVGADKYLTDVKGKAPPLLMRYWSKNAEACFDEQDRLVPWEGVLCAAENCSKRANRRLSGVWLCGSHV
jgi:DNA polymerase I-like protein with 3'-5' exonuclease and polymerase domains